MKKTKIIAIDGSSKVTRKIDLDANQFDTMSIKNLEFYLKYEATNKTEINLVKSILKNKKR
jgi:hypothetical protein